MKILLADDHALIREGFERALTALEKDTTFVHAEDRESVLAQLEAHQDTDVILLDLFMPGVNGFDLLSEVCNKYSNTPVIVISGTDDPRYMRKSIDSGASGFIPKSAPTDIMMSAIQLVQNGGVYIPADMLQKKSAGTNKSGKVPGQTLTNEIREAASKLTARQQEVLDLMGCGMSNKEIARVLNVSDHTVKIHVAAVLRLFNAANRTEAVVMAQNAGIIDV
jgi:DNA-binding NarL/FixJ family response regulator